MSLFGSLGNSLFGSTQGQGQGLFGGQQDFGNIMSGIFNQDNLFGKDGQNGLLQNISGIASPLAGLYFGNKQMGLAEDQFNFKRDMANRNAANQATLTNSQLADRQRARLGTGDGGSYDSLAAYLDKYKVQ